MFGRSTGETFDSAGVPIHYLDSGPVGDGLPVVFVHGFMGSTREWRAIRKELADRCRTVALDCRGHGRSGKPHGADAYGLDMVDDVARLMDHLGMETARVVGYSMGAEISLKLATLHPRRVRVLLVLQIARGCGSSSAPAGAPKEPRSSEQRRKVRIWELSVGTMLTLCKGFSGALCSCC